MRSRGISILELQINAVVITLLCVVMAVILTRCQQRAITCVQNLAEKRVDVPCPVSGAAYATNGCGDAKHHLKTEPVFGDRVTQTLPVPSPQREVVVSVATWGQLTRTDSAAVLELRPKGWWRYALAPVVQLLALVYFGLAVVSFIDFVRSPVQKRIEAGGCANSLNVLCAVGGIALCAWCFWLSFSSGWGRETITATHDAVERRTFVAGVESGTERWPHPLAIIPAGNGWVVVYEASGRRQVAELRGSIADEDLNALSWITDAIR